MARSASMVQNEIFRWEQQQAEVEAQLADLTRAPRRSADPAQRLAAAEKQPRLEKQLSTIKEELEHLDAELEQMAQAERTAEAAIAKIVPKGERAYGDFLAAFETLEEKVAACRALEGECARWSGYQPWPKVPAVLVLALAQTRQAMRMMAAIDRHRLERIGRKTAPVPEREKAGAAALWSELKGRLEGAGDGAG